MGTIPKTQFRKMNLIEAINENYYEAIKVSSLESCIYAPDNHCIPPLHHALKVGNKYVIDLILTGYERDYTAIKESYCICDRGNVYVAYTEDQKNAVKAITRTIDSEDDPLLLDRVLLYSNTKPKLVFVKFTAEDISLQISLSTNGYFDVNPPNDNTMNYLCWAADHKNITVFRRLLAMNADYTLRVENNTCLHIAASRGCLEIVQEILKIKNVKLNERGSDCATPLIKAAESGNIFVFNAILNKIGRNKTYKELRDIVLTNDYPHYVEVMQYTILHRFDGITFKLLELGVDPEITSPISGYSAVLYAVACGNITTVEIFQKRGVNWKATDIFNRNALTIAQERGQQQILDLIKKWI